MTDGTSASPELIAPPITAEARRYPGALIAWYGMGIFFLAQVIATMDRGILSFVVEPIRRDLHVSDVQLGLLQGLAFAIFYAVVGLPLGMIADVVSRRRLLIAGILMWSGATITSGFAHSFGQMFACRLVVGLGEATLGPCAISMIGDLFPAARRAKPMSVYLLGGSVSAGLSIMLTGAILGLPPRSLAAVPVLRDLASWRIAFVVCGALGLVVAGLLLAMPEIKREGAVLRARRGLGVAQVSRYFASHWGVFLPFYLALGCYGVGVGSLGAWGVTFLTLHFHLGLPFIGQRLGGLNIAMAAVGSLIGGLILATVIRRGGVGAKLKLAPLLPLLALPCSFIVFAPNPGIAFLLAAIPSLTLPLYGSTLLGTISELVPADMRGISVALYAFSGTMIGGTFGPLLVALATEYLFKDPAQVGSALLITSAPGLLAAGGLLALCQRNMLRLAGRGGELEQVIAANQRA